MTGRPKKSLGQHFLTDPRILARIADALEVAAGDTVVEIGPGRGALTEQLESRVAPRGRLVAIELDRFLAATLRERYRDSGTTEIVEGDVLDMSLSALARRPFLLAGNVPYNITTPILFHALARPRADRMVFLVQREVAERVVAKPGGREYGALSVNVQAIARAELLFRVKAGAFTPPPKVESALLRVIPRDDPLISPDEEEGFRRMVQAVFSFRRKTMLRVVREMWTLNEPEGLACLEESEIPRDVRPATLGPDAYARLYRLRP